MTTLLHGPFTQILTLRNLPETGPLVDDQLDVLVNGGILTQDGLITEIGDYEDLKKRAGLKAQSPGAHATVVLPGFIDVHTHMLFAGTRARDYALRVSGATYQEILKNGGGIHETVHLTRAASNDELANTLKQRLSEHLQKGITTIEIKSGYGLSVNEELRHLRVIKAVSEQFPGTIVPTCLAAHVLPKEFTEAKTYIELILKELLPQVMREQLAKRVDVFVEDGAFNQDISRHYLSQAQKLGFDVVVHADQFTTGSAKLAAELNAVSADHLESSSDDDLLALKKGHVIPVALPGASLGLGMKFAPARRALDLGLPLVIASDFNPGSAPMGELLMQACILGAAQKLTLAETLAAITVRAAKALKLVDRGTLQVGQRADFQIYEANDWREVFWRQGALKPQAVFCGGQKC